MFVRTSARELLANAAAALAAVGIESARLDARVLLAHALGTSSNEVFGEQQPTDDEVRLFEQVLSRRARREPLAYITGHKEFWNLDFAVGRGVLIPRPETETLVEEALRVFSDAVAPLRVLDVGTGSGCLLIAFLTERTCAQGTGIDSSQAALSFAKRNAQALGVADRTQLVRAAWNVPGEGKFDVVLANPPYLSEQEFEYSQPEIRLFEPREALVAGPDGLEGIRGLVPVLARSLTRTGRAFVEIGAGQRDAVSPIVRHHGLEVVRVAPDLSGVARCFVLGRQEQGACD